jgi:hypothetical protein
MTTKAVNEKTGERQSKNHRPAGLPTSTLLLREYFESRRLGSAKCAWPGYSVR